ncbi:DUF805 domain-containing protein [Planctomonas sp. JC2975]|uniref:DUF805 domain-containing protein n=1 Tax=Planctomonas sp. JC2975 TaxID=2729626 RepID=UPI001472B55D|nr:DUF805 domain-containing protein [Planctomonas sp. JC2975]NNC13718.1 DUF805 domain-containing protein [Planctomonas sp. JC2975]
MSAYPPSSPPPDGSGSQGAIPLWAPYYGASLGIAFSRFFRKYATFTGRASRSEYWWWQLIGIIIGAIVEAIYIPSLLASRSGAGMRLNVGIVVAIVLGVILFLGLIVPELALFWRRMHDANLPGPLWFLGLIPAVGWIIILVLSLLPSDARGARFDRPPQ